MEITPTSPKGNPCGERIITLGKIVHELKNLLSMLKLCALHRTRKSSKSEEVGFVG